MRILIRSSLFSSREKNGIMNCASSCSSQSYLMRCADPEGDRGSGLPLKTFKNIGFLSNTGPDHPKNHKATKPAFNVEPTSARQRNAIIYMAFRWRAADGPLIVVFGSFLPSEN